MDRVEMLAAEGGSAAAKFIEIMRSFARRPAAIVCCFEGDDQKYFGVRLDMADPKFDWSPINCGGKKVVLELYDLISRHPNYELCRCAFFIDQDFDDPIDHALRDHIYETPCYSIENLCSHDECVEMLFAAELKVSRDSDPELFEQLWTKYKASSNGFINAVSPLNAWIKAHRSKEKILGGRKLRLNEFKLEHYVSIELSKTTTKVEVVEIPNFFENRHALDEADLAEAERWLKAGNPPHNYRGKYQLEFVRLFLVCLRAHGKMEGDRLAPIGKRLKLQLSKQNFLSEVSLYAKTPACLKSFIKRIPNRCGDQTAANEALAA